MARVHHATAKKAAKFGIEITEKDGEFVLTYDGNRLVVDDAKDGVTQIVAWIEDASGEAEEPEWAGDDEEDEDEDAGKSVVKRKYKQAYRPFKQKCGDELSQLITEHVMVKDEDTGLVAVDEDKLKKFALDNGVWVASYAFLNVGMRRMNIRNRIAPRWKKDSNSIVWN